jgi:hypothetical protein
MSERQPSNQLGVLGAMGATEDGREKPMNAKSAPDVQAEYQKQLQIAKDRLMALAHHIEVMDEARHARRHALVDPTLVGDIVRVNELLLEICRFLEIPDGS